MSNDGRFDDRYLPADLYRATVSGKIDFHEARRRAHERWEADERRGGSLNDHIRAALFGSSPEGRIEQFEAARDTRGRFARADTAERRDGANPSERPTNRP